MFLELGFERTRTDAVAKQARVAAGTLFSFAQSKEELLVVAFHGELERILKERTKSVHDAHLVEQLVYVFEGPLAFYEEHGELARVFLREILLPHPDTKVSGANLVLGCLEELNAICTTAQERGDLDPGVDPSAVASNAFALYLWAVVARFNGVFPTYQDQVAFLRSSLSVQLAQTTDPGRE